MSVTKETFSLWKSIVKFINETGYWKLTKTVLFVGFSICFLYTMKNFGDSFRADMVFKQKEAATEAIFEVDNLKETEHAMQLEARKDIRPKVKEILNNTLHTLHADRAFVLELHNGSKNTAGLPFIHCSMTYEEVSASVDPVDEDYQNLTLSRFNFPEYLHENDFWTGYVDDFYTIDKKIALRMKANGANYLVITTIRSRDKELGYFGFTYCNGNKPKNTNEIISYLLTNVQHLSKLLDNNTNDWTTNESQN